MYITRLNGSLQSGRSGSDGAYYPTDNELRTIPYLCTMQPLEDRIFTIENEDQFNELALEIFNLQARENKVYNEYISHLKIDPKQVKDPVHIPFLPISFFRERRVITGPQDPKLVFESSGTSGQATSKHFVVSEKVYQRSFTSMFISRNGKPEDLCILALLPSYLERGNSSLVYMMDHLIKASKHPDSGFYLDDLEKLSMILQKRTLDKYPCLLLGVSFALLDLAEKISFSLTKNIIVLETGGMKGRRKEMVREELHETLRNAFGMSEIHSEYGMTELLSQAYTKVPGIFISPPWMKITVRDIYDPLTNLPVGNRGAINITDLANLYSCSFIASEDLGNVHPDGSFEITGRMDQSEIRGCNLMVV